MIDCPAAVAATVVVGELLLLLLDKLLRAICCCCCCCKRLTKSGLDAAVVTGTVCCTLMEGGVGRIGPTWGLGVTVVKAAARPPLATVNVDPEAIDC